MTLSTSTVTLAPGSSRTYSLAPGEAVTVATEPNCYVTVTETPDVIASADLDGQTNVRESILQYKGSWTYGPYALGGTVAVAVSLSKSTSSVSVTLGSAAAAVVGAAGGVPANVSVDTEGAASANVTAIQASLDAGGTVSLIQPGTIWINDRLVIGSDTTVFLGPKTIIKQANGISKNMLVTSSYLATPASVSLAWATGTAVTVTWASHGKVVGDYVCIDNTASSTTENSKYKGVFRVASVVDANNFTYDTMLVPTTGPTGIWEARAAVVNARVLGGRWDYNATNNPASGAEQRRMAMILAFTAHCEWRPQEFYDLLKYGAMTCMDQGSVVGDIVCDSINSTGGDMAKVYGPAFGTIIENMRGRTADDMVSVQTKEPPAFFNYMPAYGDCLGVQVRNVRGGKNSSSTSGVIFYCSPNETMKDCEADGVHGNFSGPAVRFQAGDGFAGVLLSAKARHITANATLAAQIGGGGGGATMRFGAIAVEDATHNPAAVNSDFCAVSSSSTGNKLTFRGCVSEVDSLTSPTWPTGSAAVFALVNGAVNVISVDDCEMNGVAGNARFVQLTNGASVRQINVTNSRLSGNQGVNVLASPAVTPLIKFDGCDLNLTYGVNAAASANVVAVGNTLNNATVLVRQTAGTVTLAHGGNQLLGTSSLTTGTVTASAW